MNGKRDAILFATSAYSHGWPQALYLRAAKLAATASKGGNS